MANNRLFLVHRPTKKAVLLGKRMGDGWYTKDAAVTLGSKIIKLFELADSTFMEMDDFELLIESNERVGSPVLRDDWQYGDFDQILESDL